MYYMYVCITYIIYNYIYVNVNMLTQSKMMYVARMSKLNTTCMLHD